MPVLLATVEPIVIGRLGASQSGTHGTALKDSRWSATGIRCNIVGGDALICLAVIANTFHPRRADFMTSYSTDHAHGTIVDSAAGSVSQWEVKVNGADTSYIAAKPARIIEIEAMRAGGIGTAAHNAAGSPIGGFLDVGRDLKVRFTGALARFRKPVFTPDYATFVLQAPVEYTDAVAAASVVLSKRPGEVLTDIFERADKTLALYLQLIAAGVMKIPSLDEAA